MQLRKFHMHYRYYPNLTTSCPICFITSINQDLWKRNGLRNIHVASCSHKKFRSYRRLYRSLQDFRIFSVWNKWKTHFIKCDTCFVLLNIKKNIQSFYPHIFVQIISYTILKISFTSGQSNKYLNEKYCWKMQHLIRIILKRLWHDLHFFQSW